MKNKGQLQTQETILVVFIFVIIMVIGMSVFFKFQEGSIQKELRDFKIKQLGNTLLTLPGSSEFVYTQNGLKKDSVDVLKLMAFKELAKDKSYFSNTRYMNITIYEVYPEGNKKECKSINDLGNCGVFKVYENIPKQITSKIIKNTPVSIYYPNKDRYTVGLMLVEVYNA